jgi:hypothetical protein
MPTRCNKSGCRYGTKGKLYKGKGAKARAAKQGRAIKSSQAKRR